MEDFFSFLLSMLFEGLWSLVEMVWAERSAPEAKAEVQRTKTFATRPSNEFRPRL